MHLLLIELGVTLGLLAAVPVIAGLGLGRCRGTWALLRRIAARKRLTVIGVGVAALAVRIAITPLTGIREPYIHDEFSYLLAADTFASGSLANAPHPMWVHFETFHISQQPTYMSMYPPAQGLILAAGKVLGHPIYGVWIAAAVMCASIAWMLQGWFPPVWALLGGVLAVARLGLLGYWAASFWGGAHAAIGGALALGALPRIKRCPSVFDALLLGSGILVLANSRPYEGLVLAAPVCVSLAFWATGKHRPPCRVTWKRIVLPCGLLLAAGCGAMAFYNWRVFGSALTVPYSSARKNYASAGIFIWEKVSPPPVYRHQVLRDFYMRWEREAFDSAQTPLGFLRNCVSKTMKFWFFFLGPLLTIPLLGSRSVWRCRRIRFLLTAACIFAAGLAVNAWFVAHYAAPVTALVYALLLESLRRLRFWRWGRWRVGAPLPLAIVSLSMLLACVAVATSRSEKAEAPLTWSRTGPGNVRRASIHNWLTHEPGQQLALVSYSPGHDVFDEWVFNEANIDASKVVWARRMSELHDRELLEYFPRRRVWLVEPDLETPRLTLIRP